MKVPLLYFSLCLFLLPVVQAEQARSFSSISEVIEGWTPDQQLWVSGPIGVGAPQLDGLESWLGENGPNWTIVLMKNARSQRYGNKSGMNAVEFALGEGLSNRTGFGELTDSRTGQANGAVFVLFLEERKFSYFGSEVFDKRGLGERYWVGRLDKPAISAMRNGGRMVDAVKNTVSSIESSLTRKIAEEEEQRRLAEIEKQRALEEAKQYPSLLDERIRKVVAKGDQLLETSPDAAEGPLFSPDTLKWEANRESIRELVAMGSLQKARARFAETNAWIDVYESRLDLWAAAPERFQRLDEQITAHPAPEKAPSVSGFLAKASQALRSSKTNHANGDPLYRNQLEEAERNFDRAGAAYDNWVEAKKRQRLLLQIAASAAVIGFVLFLIIASRLRRPARDEALALFEKWKRTLDGKFDELFSLMDRTSLVVGSSSELNERGYSGETEKLARETIREVDELFIMSSATDQVMDEVAALILPRSLAGRLINAFSSRNYRKAVSLLSSEPIGFDQKDHLEAILNPTPTEGEESPSRTLLGETADYDPFRISFEKLNREYDRRQTEVREQITRLEAGIDGLPIRQQELVNTLGETNLTAAALAESGSEDTLFPLDTLRRELIPAGEEQLAKAAELGETDPVAAFEDLLPEASRLVTEAGMITRTIEAFRTVDLPVMQSSAATLSSQERSTRWIDEALSQLVTESEQLGERGAETSIAERWAEFDHEITKLKGRVLSCESLSTRIIETTNPRISDIQTGITEARKELAGSLGLPPEQVLCEPGLAPEVKIASAAQGVSAALAAIDDGQALTAQKSLDQVELGLDEARSMIELSRECVERHGEIHAELTQERKHIESERAPASELLNEMQDGYAASVLTFASRFGEAGDGQLSIVNSLERADRRFAISGRELEESAAAFTSGQLIRAYTLLETVASELGFAEHQLALIRDQHEALREAETENQSRSGKLQNHLQELLVLGKDRRTIQSTKDDLQTAGKDVHAFANSLGKANSDPFVQSRTGKRLEGQLNALQDGIDGDWKAHALAVSAETSAQAAVTYCHQYLREARTDNIPDSRTLTRAIQRHGELTEELSGIEEELETDHADWNDLFARTSEIDGETAKVLSTLREELAAAREAARRLELAVSEIRKLTKWRSSYRIRVDRNAGSTALLRAKAALAQGDYADARRHAVAAQGATIRELQRARTREAQKASAAAAAAAAAARRSSFSSSSSSSFSGSSGFSSSSFSSGSGFSRSGW